MDKKYLNLLEKSFLFQGIGGEDLEAVLAGSLARISEHLPEELLFF